jgi:hypothetical protein
MVPLVYHPSHNIAAFGFERLHPFDGRKYRLGRGATMGRTKAKLIVYRRVSTARQGTSGLGLEGQDAVVADAPPADVEPVKRGGDFVALVVHGEIPALPRVCPALSRPGALCIKSPRRDLSAGRCTVHHTLPCPNASCISTPRATVAGPLDAQCIDRPGLPIPMHDASPPVPF